MAYYLTAWKLGAHYRTYPAYVQDEVEDGTYISGRWPGDAYRLARRFIALLEAAPVPADG